MASERAHAWAWRYLWAAIPRFESFQVDEALAETPILRDLGLFLVAAAALAVLGRGIRMPAIVAYMLAGLLLGPGLGLVRASDPVEVISTFGIALLLFVVGLELSLDRIKDVGRVAVIAGIGQVVFTAAGGFLVSQLLGYTPVESFFIATALTFSSTVIVVKLLDEKRELQTLYGRIAVGIFLVQDLVAIVLLTVLAGLGGVAAEGSSGVAPGLLRAFAGMAVLLAVALVASRWLLPVVLRWFAESLEALFIASLSWCLLFVLFAERLELSLEIGAFLAGLSLAQLPFNEDLRRRTHPLMSFCIAVFFVSLGSRMQLDAGGDFLLHAVVLSLFVLIGNPVIFMWIIARFGYGERTAFLTSVSVAQISEFSFVFAAMGMSAGMVDASILAIIGTVGLVTMGGSAYMILYNGPLYEWFRKRRLLRVFRSLPEEDQDVTAARSGHIVVIGMNALGRRIVAGLVSRGLDVLAIDTRPGRLVDLPCETLIGNVEYLEVLQQAQIRNARLVVSALQVEEVNRMLAIRCRWSNVPVAIHAFDQTVFRDLEELQVDHLIASKNEGVRAIAAELARVGVL